MTTTTAIETMKTARYGMDRNEAIAKIKAALKRRSGKTWSVTGGRGTAWGWITIDAPPARRTWQSRGWKAGDPVGEGEVLEVYGGDNGTHGRVWFDRPGEPFGHASPMEREELAKLLGFDKPVHCQGVGIAAASDFRIEYVDRAEGREPRVIGERYWD